MAEENKQNNQPQAEQKSGGEVAKKILKVILGILFLVGGGLLVWLFWGELLVVVKGVIGLFLILVGLITVAIARD